MNLAEPGPHMPAAPTAALSTLQPPCSPRGARLTGEGHSEETLDIPMRGQCCCLPEGLEDMSRASGRVRGEALPCVQPRLWASRKQVLAPTVGAASQLQLRSLGVASPGAVGRPVRQKPVTEPVTHQLPYFLLLRAGRQAHGGGRGGGCGEGLLVGEQKQCCDYRGRCEALSEKIPTTTHALGQEAGLRQVP